MLKKIIILFTLSLILINTKRIQILDEEEPSNEAQVKSMLTEIYNEIMRQAKDIKESGKQFSYSQYKGDFPGYRKYIEDLGYVFEEYQYPTKDGYINSIWRIPRNKSKTETNPKPLILFHGLFDCSWTFFQQNIDINSLGFYFVDRGYDVWLPNNRGNTQSFNHTSLNSSDPLGDYWKFTLDEIAIYDVPASIDFVKSKTGAKKVDFLGHSQGTTIFIMKYLNDPKYLDENVEHFVSLGTVPNLKYNKNPYIKFLTKIEKEFEELYPLENVLVVDEKVHEFGVKFLETSPAIMELFIDAIAGIVPSHRSDYKCKAKWLYYTPGGTSKNVILQWYQFYRDQKLHYFDYGKEENIKRYGKETPPDYDLENAKKWKVKMFYPVLDNDGFCYIEDLLEFYDLIEDKSVVKRVDIPGYNHMDITGGRDAPTEIFPQIVDFLDHF